MESKKFPEANTIIGFGQKEYHGIHAHKEVHPEFPGMDQFTMCFELDEEERKQVAETGCIWLRRLQPRAAKFHPIGYDVLKPKNYQTVDELKGVEKFNPETFDVKTEDFTKVNYFFKKAAVKHLGLIPAGKTEEEYTELLLEEQNRQLAANEA